MRRQSRGGVLGQGLARYRLNQGGNRQANNARWRAAMVRLTCDQRTQDYAARRRGRGKDLLTDPPTVQNGAELRSVRTAAGISLATAADELGSWPTRISELERGLKHNADLATRYQLWLTQIAS